MKKKIVALILMLALVSTFFVGCSLFETNADRDYHQVVANVSYTTESSGTLTAVVYKGEVRAQVNYAGYYYVQSYGWAPEDVVEYLFNYVARQKLLLLYAQEYLYVNKLIPDGFGFDDLSAWNEFKNKDEKNQIPAYSKFLTVDELRYCIEVVNKQFDDTWKDLIEDREKELEKNEGNSDGETASGEDDEDKIDDSELLTARDQKDRTAEDDEDEEYELNETIKEEKDIIKYFADKYEITIDDSNLSNAYFFNYVNALIRKENNDKAKIMKTCLNELKKNLENQYMDYESMLVQQMQSYITTKYTDHVKTIDKVIKQVEEDYKDRYGKLVSSALDVYSDNESYNTAVGDKTFAYAAPSKDYLQVKSILLSFSDEQKEAISNVASISPHDKDVEKILRDAYATGIVPEEYQSFVDAFATELGIKVNVSNPDYDADEDELVDAYTDASIKDKENVYANPSVDYLTILSAMANDIQAKVEKALEWADDNNITGVERYLIQQHASQEAFNDWINLVNDDGGMVSNDVYAVTPNHESSSYVEEYTVLARALTNAGVGAMAIKDYSNGKDISDSIEGDEINYTGTTEILKKANGKYTLYKEKMVSYVDEDESNEDNEISANVYTLVTENGAKISFIVNQFGIHIVMVASLPVDEKLGGTSEQVKPVKNEDGEYEDKTFTVKNDDYLYEYSVKIEYEKEKDENGEETEEFTDVIKTITVETKTIKEYLEETLTDELSNDVTRLQQLGLFSNDTYISKVDKIYNQIVDEFKDAIGA